MISARPLSALMAGLLLAQVSVATNLTPHTAQYRVKISVVSGQLNTQLRVTESGYVAHHVIRPVGFSKLITRGTMDVTSEFSSAADGVKPIRFQSIDSIRKKPDINLNFDWAGNVASGFVGEDVVSLQLESIAHDSVSIQYALMHDLLNGGASDEYVLFDVDKMRVANVSKSGERIIQTKAGKFTVIGIRHQKEGSSRITTLWCAKDLGYLPVVIEQHRKGKLKFRATLEAYTPDPQS